MLSEYQANAANMLDYGVGEEKKAGKCGEDMLAIIVGFRISIQILSCQP
jgi:hypothetical protein